MIRQHFIVLTVVTFFAGLAASAAQADNWQEFAASAIDNDQQAPDIYGNIIVWQELIEGDWDIYGADITNPGNPVDFVIANFIDDQQTPVIQRNDHRAASGHYNTLQSCGSQYKWLVLWWRSVFSN